MSDEYRYEILPLDTPDDDPRWLTYIDIFRMGLLDGRPTDKNGEIFRRHRRTDDARLGMFTITGPGLPDGAPVAAFNDCVAQLNCGAEPIPVLVINTIAVKPSHRRRGLLRRLMQRHLDAAREAGIGIAMLSASEGAIYGRFGFGVATRWLEAELTTSKLSWRAGADLAEGTVEFVEPAFLENHFETITQAHLRIQRGVLSPLEMHRLMDVGAWDPKAKGPAQDLRAAVHFDAAGTADGYALFTHKGWDSPVTSDVHRVIAADVAVTRSLWQALASMDIVEKLKFASYPGDPLPLSLTDEWAVEYKGAGDRFWLRILDLPVAVAGRGFEADGTVVLAIDDPMDYTTGTWRINAEGGRGRAERVDEEPQVRLGIDALARMWHGDRTAEELALGGQAAGTRDGLRTLSALLRVGEAPHNPWGI